MAGFVLLTGFSWVKFIDDVGRYTIASLMYLKDLPQTITNQFGTSEPKELPTSESVIKTSSSDNELKENEQTEINKTNTHSTPKKKPTSSFFSSNDNNTEEAPQELFVDIDDLMGGATGHKCARAC